jgi:hypothetical protein
MEVQAAWLEETLEEPAAPSSARKKPPRLPGAARTLPPMPVVPSKAPPRNHTMEVEMNWLEILDERRKRKGDEPTTAPDNTTKKPEARPVAVEDALKPRPKAKKPIPRED